MVIWCYMVNLPFYWDIGFSGKLKSKICDGISLPVFLFYRRLTVLLFKGKIEVNKIKNFYSMKTCLDLNNTVDSGIYYFRRQFKVNKIKNFYRL